MNKTLTCIGCPMGCTIEAFASKENDSRHEQVYKSFY